MHPRQLLNRRQAVGALLAALLPAAAWADADSVEFVRQVYAREVEMHAARTPPSNDEFYALFARDLRALMLAPHPGLIREPVGRILHAFFGWGVLPGQPVKFVDAWPRPGGGTAVAVDVAVHGEVRHLLPRMERENGLWKIANISYGNGESLRDFYWRITRP